MPHRPAAAPQDPWPFTLTTDAPLRQGADAPNQVNDLERRPPAGHGRPIHSVDLTPQVSSDQGIQPIDSSAGMSCMTTAGSLPQASGSTHPV